MSIRCLLVMVTSLAVLLPFKAESASILAPPIPARIGGTVTVDGTQLTQDTDDGYTFKVTRLDGTDYVDFNNVPTEDTDGLNASDWYLIDIPIYDAADQPDGAISGDKVVIHVYYEYDGDAYELDVTYPSNGRFTVGQAGSVVYMELVAKMPPFDPEDPVEPVDAQPPSPPAAPQPPSPPEDPEPPAEVYEISMQTAQEPSQTPITAEESEKDSNPEVAGINTKGPIMPPAKIGGTVTVDGTQIIQATDTEYTFVVTKQNGDPYEPAAEDIDGLNEYNFYNIDIPIYDANEQLGGATPGETAVIHVYKDGTELTVTSPGNGEFFVQESGSLTQIDLVVTTPTPQPPTSSPGAEENHPPKADAGQDQTVDEGDTVTLDGSNSSDPNVGDSIVSYLWSQADGTTVTLSPATAPQTTFIAPDVGQVGEALTFELTVTDNSGLQCKDTVIVYVRSPENVTPIADAGSDQTVDEGATVTLDGSNSSDPDDEIHRYLWSQTLGTPVTLSDTSAIQPTFITPPVDSNGTQLEFLLSVIDNGGLEHTDKVSIDIIDNGITCFDSDVLPTLSTTDMEIGLRGESGGAVTSFLIILPASISDETDKPDDFIYGLFDIQAKSNTIGGTVKLSVFLANPAPDGYKWYKYSTNNGWYDFSDYAEFNDERDQVILTLTDGGIGDDDGIANGMIKDPSGLAFAIDGTGGDSNSDGSAIDGIGGSSCFISAASYGFPMTDEVTVLRIFCNHMLLILKTNLKGDK